MYVKDDTIEYQSGEITVTVNNIIATAPSQR